MLQQTDAPVISNQTPNEAANAARIRMTRWRSETMTLRLMTKMMKKKR
jgi:hypothetical protein